jgi:hypothetical protein
VSTYIKASTVLESLARGLADSGASVEDLLFQVPRETLRDFRVALAAGMLGDVVTRAEFAVDHSSGRPVCTLNREHVLGVEVAMDDTAPPEGRVVRRA